MSVCVCMRVCALGICLVKNLSEFRSAKIEKSQIENQPGTDIDMLMESAMTSRRDKLIPDRSCSRNYPVMAGRTRFDRFRSSLN